MARKLISASRRTDIAAFYGRWLLRRLEAGFCEWIHPFGGRLNRVSLKSEDTLAIVFWTRNPAPLLPVLPEIEAAGHSFCFHFTLTGYPEELESHNPPLGASLRNFRRLSGLVGPEAVIWRYDPIVISTITPPAFHLRNFASIARELRGAARRVYFSFSSGARRPCGRPGPGDPRRPASSSSLPSAPARRGATATARRSPP